jgi:transcriptional regulator with XRE-family HTH domain
MPKRPTTSIDVHVGGRVRALRQSHGLSQGKLAAALNVTYQQIQKYEKGANRVSLSTLLDMARLLGASPRYFFEGIESLAEERGRATPRAPAAEPRPDSKEVQTLIGSFLAIKEPSARRKALRYLTALART